MRRFDELLSPNLLDEGAEGAEGGEGCAQAGTGRRPARAPTAAPRGCLRALAAALLLAAFALPSARGQPEENTSYFAIPAGLQRLQPHRRRCSRTACTTRRHC